MLCIYAFRITCYLKILHLIFASVPVINNKRKENYH